MKTNCKTGLTIGIAVIFTGLFSLTGGTYTQGREEHPRQQAEDKLRTLGDEVMVLMQAMGAAFECSELARRAEPAERKRLFKYGYDAGMRLIPAWSAYEKLEKGADHRDELFMQQTPDFLLGVFFALARQSADKHVFEPKVPELDFEAVWTRRAKAQFEKLNCRLIGLGAHQ